MKYRLIGLSAVLAFALLAFVGVALASGPEQLVRYHQHEQARSLEDLAPEEQRAASSTETDAATFATHLPIVSIQTDGQPMPGRLILEDDDSHVVDEEGRGVRVLAEDGGETIPCVFELFDNETETPELANRLSDTPIIDTDAEIRIRGASSSQYTKSSYRVEFTLDDRVTPNPQEVLGMGVEADWILNGPFLDKTLMHNYFSFNVFGEIFPYTPDVRYVELFLDGQYRGIYVLMEKVKMGEDRVNLRPTDSNATQTSYLVQRDWYYAFGAERIDELIQETRQVTEVAVAIKYPNANHITPEQRQWIQDDLNAIERQLYSYDYNDGDFAYRSVIDAESFIDYALVTEFTLNDDATAGSTYYYRDLGDRLHIGPIWDFNNAYGYMNNTEALDYDEFFTIERPFYSMLYRDRAFTEAMIERWRELREGMLSDERLFGYIDDVVNYLGPAITRNYGPWGYTLDSTVIPQLERREKLTPDDVNPTSYAEAVEDFKRFIARRGAAMDANIETLRQFSHDSATKPQNYY